MRARTRNFLRRGTLVLSVMMSIIGLYYLGVGLIGSLGSSPSDIDESPEGILYLMAVVALALAGAASWGWRALRPKDSAIEE